MIGLKQKSLTYVKVNLIYCTKKIVFKYNLNSQKYWEYIGNKTQYVCKKQIICWTTKFLFIGKKLHEKNAWNNNWILALKTISIMLLY